jgi:antitoxin CptB
VNAKAKDAQLSKLRWRCRRGMRELDVVLERYLQHRYAQAPPAERAAFERLLELQDPDLFGFLLRRVRPQDAELAHVLDRIIDPIR